MIFIEEMDKVIYEIKQNIKSIEKYIEQLESDNITIDTLLVETIIEELEYKISSLYILTSHYY